MKEAGTMFPRRLAAGLSAAVLATGVAVSGSLPVRAAPMQDIELHAALHGSHAYPRAAGAASYESGDHGRHLDVRVSHIARLAGWHLVAFVHGVRAGTMTVSRAGYAHLDRHGGIPPCRAGQPVRIRTRSGTLVAAGIFRLHHHDN